MNGTELNKNSLSKWQFVFKLANILSAKFSPIYLVFFFLLTLCPKYFPPPHHHWPFPKICSLNSRSGSAATTPSRTPGPASSSSSARSTRRRGLSRPLYRPGSTKRTSRTTSTTWWRTPHPRPRSTLRSGLWRTRSPPPSSAAGRRSLPRTPPCASREGCSAPAAAWSATVRPTARREGARTCRARPGRCVVFALSRIRCWGVWWGWWEWGRCEDWGRRELQSGENAP